MNSIPLENKRAAAIPFVADVLAGARPGGSLDIHDYLVHHPVATFFFRVAGDAMQAERLFSGDILVVDRSIPPRPGHVVVAFVEGECVLRRLAGEAGNWVLEAAAPGYPSLPLADGAGSEIWGVVVGQFRRLIRQEAVR